ncbi:MAG: YdaS family helix-turn-helix protein [Porticoccaceae bacterium]|nr:helix-turn-helix domain-containing protein [Pseudomonadales bacterium]MCP5170932.1 helix-turn-helix domain-containing protein [Pseudomonadales bacterium]MCP5301828.1 helix-turn-helix domain-containing protein [Pseudomonadales bacterium]
MTPVEALRKAIKIIGGQTATARAISRKTGVLIRQQHVWNWLNRDGGVPPEYAPILEEVTREMGVALTREQLCPQFYNPQ